MSITSLVIWLYAFITFRIKNMSAVNTVKDLRLILVKKNWEEAMDYCHKNKSLLSKMINSAINSRKHGHEFMIDSMKSEGKRLTTSHWQKVSILNDIVVIAPMLGLLGTVLGMFYAFYDINRSVESITALFDGLGIAVGTTVAGLIVSIVSMTFSTTLKYRLMKIFNHLESEALDLSSLIIVEKKVKKKD
jgi:biopolymer transport protein ExbB